MNITEEDLKYAKENLGRLGFECKNMKSIPQKYLYYAGTPKKRARQLNIALKDSKSDLIFVVMGGDGAVHLLDYIDYKGISNPRKTLIGYSDITILLLALYSRTNVRCIHGPNMGSICMQWVYGHGLIMKSEDIFKNKLIRKTIYYLQKALNRENYRIDIKGNKCIIVEGYAKAEIIGGNTSLIGRTLGTSYEIDTKGKILFFEQLEGKASLMFDILWQLKLAGKFDSIMGIILGDFREAIKDNMDDYLREFFKDFSVPVITNQKIGHTHPNISIPYGETCIIDTKNKYWEIKFKKN